MMGGTFLRSTGPLASLPKLVRSARLGGVCGSGECGGLAVPGWMISGTNGQQDRFAVLVLGAVGVVPLEAFFVTQDSQFCFRGDGHRGQLVWAEIVDDGARGFADRRRTRVAGRAAAAGVFCRVDLNVQKTRFAEAIAHPLPNGLGVVRWDVVEHRGGDDGIVGTGGEVDFTDVREPRRDVIGEIAMGSPFGDPGQPAFAQVDRFDVVSGRGESERVTARTGSEVDRAVFGRTRQFDLRKIRSEGSGRLEPVCDIITVIGVVKEVGFGRIGLWGRTHVGSLG